MLENYWNSSGDYTDILYDKSNEGIAKSPSTVRRCATLFAP